MTFKTAANAALGLAQASPAIIDATAVVPVGTICKMYDDTQGEAEFIYLPGVANLVAGDAVVYDLTPGSQSTTRAVDNTFNNSGRSVAFALNATTSGFGWFQISGVTIANVPAGTVAGVCMLNATTGQVGNTADAGDQILNARILTAVGTPAANKAYVQINRPHIQGQIT